jgi:hypothetical protein
LGGFQSRSCSRSNFRLRDRQKRGWTQRIGKAGRTEEGRGARCYMRMILICSQVPSLSLNSRNRSSVLAIWLFTLQLPSYPECASQIASIVPASTRYNQENGRSPRPLLFRQSRRSCLLLRFIRPLNSRFSHCFSSRDDREKYDPKLFFVKV